MGQVGSIVDYSKLKLKSVQSGEATNGGRLDPGMRYFLLWMRLHSLKKQVRSLGMLLDMDKNVVVVLGRLSPGLAGELAAILPGWNDLATVLRVLETSRLDYYSLHGASGHP